jgi:two-component system response regulator HydG
MREYARKYNRPMEGISNQAMTQLMNNRWPGNVRELRHCIERAVILADGQELGLRDFISLSDSAAHPHEQVPSSRQTLDDMEKATIDKCLRENHGNISHAARDLGLTRTSLYRRIEKYGL